jgi:polar amino acid transport system substrate-binding protein
MRKATRTMAAGGVLALALGLAGCGSSDEGGAAASSSPAVAKDEALAAMVPADVASDGKLQIGTDASYAPNQFVAEDGKTIVGWDVELTTAVAQVLGLQAEFQNAPFDSIVSGTVAGKYELGDSSFTINPERIKQVNMPSYFNAGTSWAVPTGNPNNITPDAACGFKIAVQRGTVQVDDVTMRSKACTDAGKGAITIEQYQLQSDATAAVVSGKDDAMLSDSPVIDYALQQTGGKLQTTGEVYDAAPYGYAVPKVSGDDFAKAIQGAVQRLIDDGTYEQILTKWNVQAGAVTTSELNPTS